MGDRSHPQLLLLQLRHRPAHQGRGTTFASRTGATKSQGSAPWIVRLVRSPVEAPLSRCDICILLYQLCFELLTRFFLRYWHRWNWSFLSSFPKVSSCAHLSFWQ